MHELSLYGQIPPSRHNQVLQILAGVAAMQPREVIERHLIYKPVRFATHRAQIGGSQAIQSQKVNTQAQAPKELFYMQLVCDVLQSDTDATPQTTAFNGPDGVIDLDMEPSEELTAARPSWSMQFHDIPDAGKRPVVSRMMNKTDIEEGDAHDHMKGLGYE